MRFSYFALSVALAAFPSAATTPHRPLVESKQLQKLISRTNLLKHARKLTEFADLSYGNRAFGSKGHNATVLYIKRLLDETGYYDTHLQTFPYTYAESNATLAVGETVYSTRGLWFGPPGLVEAPLVALEEHGCTSDDFPPTVEGKLVLIERGVCVYGIKVALAGAAKAAGVVIYNDLDSDLAGGSLGAISRPEIGTYVPVGGISGINGRSLKAALDAGTELVGTLNATGLIEERWSSNLIATSRQGDKNNIVWSGSHSDSVHQGPGINDDGSGTIGNLEVALQLGKKGFRLNNAVRFSWWTAEEYGLIGSAYHLRNLTLPQYQSELDKVALYLNFDMIASGNSGYFIYDGDGDAFNRPGPPGSEKIEKLYQDFFEEKGLRAAPTNMSGSSDYEPFLVNGVPVGGVFTGAGGVKTAEGAQSWGGEAGRAYDPCYHTKCDTIENIRPDVWEVNVQAIAHAIATYARSVKGFPRGRRDPTKRAELWVDKLSYEERRHYGCSEDHDHEVSWE